jgi:hypothetical protein
MCLEAHARVVAASGSMPSLTPLTIVVTIHATRVHTFSFTTIREERSAEKDEETSLRLHKLCVVLLGYYHSYYRMLHLRFVQVQAKLLWQTSYT